MSFFNDCVEEMGMGDLNMIKLMAMGVRGSRVEKFDEFLETLEPEETDATEYTPSLHEKNMDALKSM